MTIQLSVTVRNARADATETTIGASPHLRIYTGSPPADCATAEAGTLLADLTLPSDWMAAASGGGKGMAGTWQDASANANGEAGHFRILDSGLTTCHMQGTVSGTGGSGDLKLQSTTIAIAGPITITEFTLTEGNA
jgi:hypothetical protein